MLSRPLDVKVDVFVLDVPGSGASNARRLFPLTRPTNPRLAWMQLKLSVNGNRALLPLLLERFSYEASGMSVEPKLLGSKRVRVCIRCG